MWRECGEWYVTFGDGADVHDVAGPFDDEHDAWLAARRHSDDVGGQPYGSGFQPSSMARREAA